MTSQFCYMGDLERKLNVAVIPDGNRRWAKMRTQSGWEGHRAGTRIFLDEIIPACLERNDIQVLAAWGLSQDNFRRPEIELMNLFHILDEMIKEWWQKALQEQIQVRWAGRRDRLPTNLVKKLCKLEDLTREFHRLTVILALDYDGKEDTHMAYLRASNNGTRDIDTLRSEVWKHLEIPKLDLVLRTGADTPNGGYISGFGALSIADAEMVFDDKLWPDFTRAGFEAYIEAHKKRTKRKGA